MANSLNRATLIGRLGKDPEIRRLQDGNAVANLSVATSESWKDKRSGEWKEKTEWHRIVVWNEKTTEYAEKNLKKGDLVRVEGKIETRKWTDQQGVEKYSTEIVIGQFAMVEQLMKLGSANDNGGGGGRDDDRGGDRGGSSRGRGRDDDRGDDRGSSRSSSRGRDDRDDRGRDDDRRDPPRRAVSSGSSSRNDMDDDIPF